MAVAGAVDVAVVPVVVVAEVVVPAAVGLDVPPPDPDAPAAVLDDALLPDPEPPPLDVGCPVDALPDEVDPPPAEEEVDAPTLAFDPAAEPAPALGVTADAPVDELLTKAALTAALALPVGAM